MSLGRTLGTCLVMLVASTAVALAQESPIRDHGDRAQILTTLRSFYFNLAHQDWEAMAADILPAKVLAHRPAPEALAARSAAGKPGSCNSKAALVDEATLRLDQDWAEASVPRCTAGSGAVDEFRLIHLEARWRIVYIDLHQEPVNVSAGP